MTTREEALEGLRQWLLHPDRSYSPHALAMEALARLNGALALSATPDASLAPRRTCDECAGPGGCWEDPRGCAHACHATPDAPADGLDDHLCNRCAKCDAELTGLRERVKRCPCNCGHPLAIPDAPAERRCANCGVRNRAGHAAWCQAATPNAPDGCPE